MPAHDHSSGGISGGDLPLSSFAGRPVLVVNTASECEYTPQYAGMQSLWQRYRDRGLAVLGVPSNDFGAQESGGAAQIQVFCESDYQVNFSLTAKQTVIGGEAHSFCRWIVKEFGEAAVARLLGLGLSEDDIHADPFYGDAETAARRAAEKPPNGPGSLLTERGR